jgi:hypothetical protein
VNRRNRRRQPASLVGFDVKVKRAREHLDAFRETDARIDRAGEYEFLGEIRSDGREHIYGSIILPHPIPSGPLSPVIVSIISAPLSTISHISLS